MDPITAAAAVITAVCAIAGAVNSAQQIYARRKKKAESPESDETVPTGAFDISLRINHLLSKFGRNFGQRLDETVLRQVLRLQPQLKTVLSDLRKLRSEVDSKPTTGDIEKRAARLWKQANALKDEIEQALEQFTKRIDATGVGEPPQISARPLRFCQGAILCQSGKADARKLSVGDKPGRWGFVCRYCFLEVADYSAVRFLHGGEPVVYAEMLAASHVVACDSFSDRRAYYKCLACYANHRDVDFSSASALEKHMQNHPGYSFVRNEPEVAEATRDKIRCYVLEPKPEVRVFSAEVDDVDVSPVSSPDLTAQDLEKPPGLAQPHAPGGPRVTSAPIPSRPPVPSPAPSNPLESPVPVRRSVPARPPVPAPIPSQVELPEIPFTVQQPPVELPAFQQYGAYADAAQVSAGNLGVYPDFHGSATNVQEQAYTPYRGPSPYRQGVSPNPSRGPSPPADRDSVPSRGSSTSQPPGPVQGQFYRAPPPQVPVMMDQYRHVRRPPSPGAAGPGGGQSSAASVKEGKKGKIKAYFNK